jgi:thiosulfate/3-mercaptopyruvate sulfurtransferase
MRRRVNTIFIAVIALVLCSCSSCDSAEVRAEYPTEYHSLKYLIEVQELVELSADTSVTVLDIRPQDKYLAGHIPGAINAWRPALRDHSMPFGGMIGSRAQTEALFDSLGIASTDKIVIYDGKGGCDAARLWWMLQIYGYDNNAILNGGLAKWELEGNPTDTKQTILPASGFKFVGVGDPSLYAAYWDVEEAMADPNTIILDTRTPGEFSGERQKKGASRAGRIPGALLFDWANSVHLDKDHSLKSPRDLLYMLDSLGITTDKNIITYCHSGVRSAHTTFVLSELLGFEHVRNYDGSWTEWSYMEELPIEADVTAPTILK